MSAAAAAAPDAGAAGPAAGGGDEADEAAHRFTVASWNVLAAAYASEKFFPLSGAAVLSWERRGEALLERLEGLDADVLLLQEVDRYAESFRPRLLAMGYECAFARRPAAKLDGCLTAWRASRFRLSAARAPEAVDLDDLSRCADGRSARTRLARHNVALLVTLEEVAAPHRAVLVSNAHLFWNPLHDDVKLAQAVYLARRVEHAAAAVAAREPGAPAPAVVFGGDFNSTPESAVVRFLEAGGRGGPPEAAQDAARSAEARAQYSGARLLLDSGLGRVARWLRSVGVDAAYAGDESPGERTLRVACDERRLLVTQSAKLVERRGCPPYYLVSAARRGGLVAAFGELVGRFGYDYDPDAFVSRCTVCNAGVTSLTPEDVAALSEAEVPSAIRGGRTERGVDIEFYRCRNAGCAHVYWWSSRRGPAEERHRATLRRARVRYGLRRAAFRDLRQRYHLAADRGGGGVATSLLPAESVLGAATSAVIEELRAGDTSLGAAGDGAEERVHEGGRDVAAILAQMEEMLPPLPNRVERPASRVRSTMHTEEDVHPVDLLEVDRSPGRDAAALLRELRREARRLAAEDAKRKRKKGGGGGGAAAAADEPPVLLLDMASRVSRERLEEHRAAAAGRPAVPRALLDDLTDFGVFSLALRHNLALRSAYEGPPPPEVTNLTHRFSGCLDYVMFGEARLAAVARRPLPSEHQILTEWGGPLPCERWPSDHLALHATLEWR